MRLPIRDDDLGETETHFRQPGKLGGRGHIYIEPFARGQRLGMMAGTIALGAGRAGGESSQQLHLAWRLAGTSGEVPHTLSHQGQCQQEEHGPRFGGRHGAR
jgi:hypothetical protein